MKKLLLAAFAAFATFSASAFEWDETGYYYPEEEPDSIWTEWEPFTTCDIEWAGLNAGFWTYDMEVKKRVSKDPNNHKWQWSFVNYFASKTDLTVEYDPDTKKVRIPVTRKGVNNIWDGEPLLTTDWNTFYGTEDPYSSWDEVDGKLNLWHIDYYPNQDMGDGTYEDKLYACGTHKIQMHGFVKYDVNIGIDELVDKFDHKVKLDFTTHPKDVCWELVNDLVLKYDTVLIDRIAADKKNPIAAAGEVDVTLKEGVNSIVAVSYDKKGNRVVSIKNVWCMPKDESNWKSIGKGKFTEDAVLGLGGDWNPTTMDVEIEENTSKAGLYRLVDPYKNLPSHWKDFTYGHGDRTDYLYIDASKPNEVVLGAYATGISDKQLGEAYLTSKAYEAKRLGKLKPEWINDCGKLNDNRITFPASTIGVRLPEYTAVLGQDLVYWVNNNGQFAIDLPNSGVDVIGTDTEGTVRYYNLQGLEVTNPVKGQMVIEVKNGKSRKVIL